MPTRKSLSDILRSLFGIFRSLFRIKREERCLASFLLVVFLALDALVVCKYYDVFTPQTRFFWFFFCFFQSYQLKHYSFAIQYVYGKF